MNIRPTSDRVFIRRAPKQSFTESGIALPGRAAEVRDTGTVVAVGPGRVEHGVHRELDVEPGERVLFHDHGAPEVEVDGEKLLVVREEDIMAVVEP